MYNKQLNQMKKNFKQTDVICIVDIDGNILYYNNYNDVCNKLGSNDVIGKPFLELYPWLTRETSTLLKVLDRGEPIVNEFQSLEVDHNFTVNAINSAFPLKNKSNMIGAVIVSTNLDTESEAKKITANKIPQASFQAKYSFDDILTINEELEHTKKTLKKAASRDSNIFIYGETGTGKELFAHSIHNESNRRHKPFVAQNCAAIPGTLIESILFGSSKGSFTGAQEKKGIFEIADGGTIFLDEINSMPIDMQVKLLRIIEEKSVRKIGSHKDIPIDVRIIASTNERPEKLVAENKFRMDLFYRLNVISAEIPPLRDRKEDINLLCDAFIHYYNQAFNENIKGLHANAQLVLNTYDWPGNVRELKNCIESSFNLVNSNMIMVEDLPKYILTSKQVSHKKNITKNKSLTELIDEYEKSLLEDILTMSNFNISHSARMLKVPRQTIYYKMNKYKIQKNKREV
ncbi:sigma-54 interaction domain-containing protein [Siminovitchia sp. 179-K 8D1 HS]|uniref:sigma-54 interaction domain-containing protein n=1 Tax=Siminovitchia sp. 179-K 8D1 HS TaxID=3142385 RepID=UPI0039A2599A